MSACYAGDLGSIHGSGRTPGEGNGNPFHYSCLENPLERGARWATVHGVAKCWTRLSDFTFTFFLKSKPVETSKGMGEWRWNLSFFLNWRIIALQYCVGFCCSTWISSKYTYIPSLLRPPPIPYPRTSASILKDNWRIWFRYAATTFSPLCCCCSVPKSHPTLCDPMDCRTPGSPVLKQYFPEFAQIHVHWVGVLLAVSSSANPFSFCL